MFSSGSLIYTHANKKKATPIIYTSLLKITTDMNMLCSVVHILYIRHLYGCIL